MIAATAVFVAALGLPWQADDLPHIQQTEGSVRLVVNGQSMLAMDQRVPQGAVVSTGEDALAVLQYPDGTVLRLRSGSRLQIENRKRLFLTSGLLEADVVRQRPSAPMIIRTPHAEIEVLGTEVSAVAETAATRVELLAGRVDVVRLADGRSVRLQPGEYTVAGDENVQLTAKPLPTRLTTPAVEIRHPDDALAFSPTGDVLVTVEKEELRLWKPDFSKQVGQLLGHEQKVLALSFSADGRLFASGTDDPFVVIWDVPAQSQKQRIQVGEPGVATLALTPDGELLAAADKVELAPNTCRVRLWEVATGEELPSLTADSTAVSAIAFSEDGQRLAAGTRTGDVVLWDTATGREISLQRLEASRVLDVAFRSDNSQLLVCHQRGTLRIVDAQSLETKRTWQRPQEQFRRLRLSPDGRTAAVGTSSGVIRLWNCETGQERAVIEVDDVKGVRSLSFSPDGPRC